MSALQSLFFVYALITDGDAEGVYLYHGYLAVTGQISLYQDEMTGHRVPLPYYVIGLSQLLWGPSLIAARLVAAAIGLATLIVMWRLASRLGGEDCGVLTLLFAATQSYLIGYFAWATFHSIISFLLTAGLFVLLVTDLPSKRIVAMGFSTLLFFTRPQIIPLQLLATGYLAWTAKRRGERWAIIAVAAGPPTIFFMSDPNHLKLLAWIGLGPEIFPVVSRFLLAFGFQAPPIPYRHESGWSSVLGALALLGRSYKAWIVAAAVLGMVAGTRLIRRKSLKAVVADRRILAVIAVIAYLAAWQVLIVRYSLKAAIGYFPSFAILAALPLGYGFSVVLARCAHRPVVRAGVIALLAVLFLAGPKASPPPALPLAVAYDRPVMVAEQHAVERLRTLVPRGSRVFLYGPSETLFMAGLRPYVQQANFLETLSPISDPWVRHRSGLWGETEIRQWLGRDVDYAVINVDGLRAVRDVQHTPVGNNVDLIESLLDRHFRLIATLDTAASLRLHVYRRAVPVAREPAASR